MRQLFKLSVAAIAASLGLGGSGASGGTFQVTNAAAASGHAVDNIAQARQLLAGQIPARAFVNTTASVVNYVDPEAASGYAHFSGKTPFPVNTSGIDWYAALHVTGTLVIPSAGNYTLGVNSDDGFDLTVGNFNMSEPSGRTATDSFGTFNFPAAGQYALDFTYFQGTGQSEVELFASPGSYTSFGAPGSNFQLIGSTAPGALQVAAAPEPGTLALLAIATVPMLARRRR